MKASPPFPASIACPPYSVLPDAGINVTFVTLYDQPSHLPCGPLPHRPLIKTSNMKKEIFTLLIFCPLVLWGPHAAARIWRVNNNAGVSANFTDFPAAVTGAGAGDTIYLESSATAYSGVSNLSKKLIIIGTG